MQPDGMPAKRKAKHDWKAIRHEYVTSPPGEDEVTLEMLCRKHVCGQRQIEDRSAREKWVQLRERHRERIAELARKKAEETAAQRLHRHTQYMRLVQATAGRAMVEGKTVPSPRDGIEAVKTERVLFGETSDQIRVEGLPDDESEAVLHALAKVRRRKRREKTGREPA